MSTSATITSSSEFFTALEQFQQVFDHKLDQVNKTDFVEKSIAKDLNLQAINLHQAAARVLPAGKNKDQILRHLIWCQKDTQSWINLFSDPETIRHNHQPGEIVT
jgi:hypothetical protein